MMEKFVKKPYRVVDDPFYHPINLEQWLNQRGGRNVMDVHWDKEPYVLMYKVPTWDKPENFEKVVIPKHLCVGL